MADTMSNETPFSLKMVPYEDTVVFDPDDCLLTIQPGCTGDEYYASVVDGRELWALLSVWFKGKPLTAEEIAIAALAIKEANQ